MLNNKIRLLCLGALVFLLGSVQLEAQEGSSSQLQFLTLKDCYEKALKKSEVIAIEDETLLQAQAQYKETLGSALPELLFKYSSIWQDQSGLEGSGSLGSFTQSPQTESNFKIRKNLFTGYKELAALRGGSSFINQRRFERERAIQQLFFKVAAAFYGVLQAEANLSSTQVVLGLAQGRLVELKERVRLGRTREADLHAMDYQVATLESQVLVADQLKEERTDTLSFLIGNRLEASLKDEGANLYDLTSLEDYMNRLPARSDMKAKLESIGVAKAVVRIERSGHYPKVDLSANYYLERSGFRKPIDWDIVLGVEVPIWSWNAVQSSVQKAESVLRQREKELEESKRKAEIEVKAAYRNYIFSHKKVDLHHKALQSARKEYELQVRDFKLNLVTTVEVLDSLNRLFQAELASNNSALEARMTEIELKVASGMEPKEILKP